MTMQLILQIEDITKFQQILDLAKRLKVKFRYDAIATVPPQTDNIVWHWDNCETGELALDAFADDWNSEADKVWDTV